MKGGAKRLIMCQPPAAMSLRGGSMAEGCDREQPNDDGTEGCDGEQPNDDGKFAGRVGGASITCNTCKRR